MINSSDDEEGESQDVETAEAEELLSWRPGVCLRPLPSKGGPKFFGCTGASFELRKVDEQLRQYKNVLHSKKVRKASKLGKAEWITQCGLARVSKQGKFIQTMGHHNGKYFALYPEEALFLLDIGDIELTMNDVPMSLQEAFSVISRTKNCQFSLDHYTTFSYLVKCGFVVQRYGMGSKRVKSKRRRSSTEKPTSSVKLPKLDDRKKIVDKPSHMDDCESSTSHSECRQWYAITTTHDTTDTTPLTSTGITHVDEVAFPNMTKRSNNHLPAPSENLLPAGIPSHSYFIDDIWFERIKKDEGKRHVQQSGSHSRKKVLGSDECKNWSEYKTLKLEVQKAENAKLKKLHDWISTWEVKPLILPGTSSVEDGLHRLRTIMATSESTNVKLQSSTFDLNFNVYTAGSTPFKKTNPGRASFVVIVTNAGTPPPTSLDILSLLRKSNGVPVRFAVVDDGQLSFYEFEMTNISVV